MFISPDVAISRDATSAPGLKTAPPGAEMRGDMELALGEKRNMTKHVS